MGLLTMKSPRDLKHMAISLTSQAFIDPYHLLLCDRTEVGESKTERQERLNEIVGVRMVHRIGGP